VQRCRESRCTGVVDQPQTLTPIQVHMKKAPLALRIYAHTAIKRIAFVLATGLALWVLPLSGHADSDGSVRVPLLPRYAQECAACHLAYPPGMLPVASWQRIMGALSKHYGTDASLDAATVQELTTWLKAHAGTYRRVGKEPPQDRISTSAWFVRKHRDLNPAIWKQAEIKSAANCIACHTRADKGSFSEREITFPKDLDARFRRNWAD